MFYKGHIYRRTEETGHSEIFDGLHDYEEGILATFFIRFGDEFLVLEDSIYAENGNAELEFVHVLGCNKEFLGWALTIGRYYKEVLPEY